MTGRARLRGGCAEGAGAVRRAWRLHLGDGASCLCTWEGTQAPTYSGGSDRLFLAITQGGGGGRAASFLKASLSSCLPPQEMGSAGEKTVKRCLLDTFKHTDEEFLRQAPRASGAWPCGGL